ncbi:MAG: sensor histidine kinase, partial [Peptococcales bacterium]
MDIKLKNIKYSIGTKIIAVILLWLAIMGGVGSGFFLLYNIDYVRYSDFYDTREFQRDFGRLSRETVELHVNLKSEESIKASGESEDVINNNLERFRYLNNNLNYTVNFAYYLHNPNTDEVFTNLPTSDALALIKEQGNYLYSNKSQIKPNFNYYYNGEIRDMLRETDYEFYATVIQPLQPGDSFYENEKHFNKIKNYSYYAIGILIVSLTLFLATAVHLLLVSGRREKDGEIVLAFIDKIYVDVHTFFVFIAAIISVGIVANFSFVGLPESFIIVAIVFGIDMIIGISYILSLVRQYKNGTLIKNTLLYRAFGFLERLISMGFKGEIFKGWTLGLLLAYGLVNGILYALTISGPGGFLFGGFLLIVFNGIALYFLGKALVSLTQIMKTAKEISRGNLDYPLDHSQISPAFADFAGDIKSIQGGLKNAVMEAVKGERMKTDLITNV